MVSIIIPCKNRLDHLKKTLLFVGRQTVEDMECVVVDYNCPQGTIDYINENYNGTKIRCVKAAVGEGEWNLSASRNFGYKHAGGDLLCFIDADTRIMPQFLDDCLARIKDNCFMSGQDSPPWHCCGCAMMYKADFEKVKGYNEMLKGWGFEDYDMYERLKKIGINQMYFNKKLLYNIAHPDNIRNQYHERIHPQKTNRENHLIAVKEFKGL